MSEVYQAARATDPIGHGYGMVGILAGVVVGALIVVAGVVTGGVAIALIIAAAALSGAALANGIQRAVGAKNPWTGDIGFGSSNVRINGLGAARVMMDFAMPICNGLYGANHFPLLPIPPIAEGSSTVKINGQLAARVTSRLVCAADITDGSPNVWIGGATEQVLLVVDIEAIVTVAAMVVVGAATVMISGPLLGAAYLAGGLAVGEGINYLAETHIGPGWGGIINGTLGFLALGLGAVYSRRAATRQSAATRQRESAATRQRVLENIARSRQARQASDFGGRPPASGSRATSRANWRAQSSQQRAGRLHDAVRNSAPIIPGTSGNIPPTARVTDQWKPAGYRQVRYNWSEGGFKYEARWHTRTPGAPANQGDTFVVTRTTPGSGGTKPTSHILTQGSGGSPHQWARGSDWFNAVQARQNGTATPAQEALLDSGHFPAPAPNLRPPSGSPPSVSTGTSTTHSGTAIPPMYPVPPSNDEDRHR